MFVIFFFFLSWNFNALVNTRLLLKPTAVKRMQFFVTIVCVLHSLSFLELFVPPRCSAIYIHQSAANAIWNGSKTINLLKPPKAKYPMPVILAVIRAMHIWTWALVNEFYLIYSFDCQKQFSFLAWKILSENQVFFEYLIKCDGPLMIIAQRKFHK